MHLAAAFAALETCETGADATADLACFTTTHADGLGGHLLSRAGLLGSTGGWELHLLGLGLLNFLGRHICEMCYYLRIYRKSVGKQWGWIGGGEVSDVCVDGREKGREGGWLALSHRCTRRPLG